MKRHMAQGKMTVEDDEIVRILEEIGDPAYTTAEIGELVDMSTEGVRGRLEKLEDEGRVISKKPTSRTVLWWPRSNYEEDVFSA